jgi:hypothetical protein
MAVTAGQAVGTFQNLLEGLSLKELRILRRYPDLSARVGEIARMTTPELIEALSEDYKLNPIDCHGGDVWITTRKLEDSVPDWFATEHTGWMVSLTDGEFDAWAQHFLMQEVRINIWIRYMEYKKKNPTKQGNSSPGHGNYL